VLGVRSNEWQTENFYRHGCAEYLSQRSQRKYLFSFIAEKPINETFMPFSNVKSVVDA
jgi:hypothetical protein